jgi:uncharacterized protein with beta-barrel porin domain/C1A family cysteine protease
MKPHFHIFRHFLFVYLCCFFVSLIVPAQLSAQQDPLPSSFDLRDVDGKNYLTPIKDQARLGTCYAFAAVSAAESTYNLAMDRYGDDTVSLSESFIVWSLGSFYDGFPARPYGEGGYPWMDELQALVDYGTCTDDAFPYMGTKTEAEPYQQDVDRSLDYHWDAPRYQFAGWHRVPASDLETIKRAITTFGAVDARVLVTDDFVAYTDGVFSDNATTADYPIEYFSSINHSISLVGWDDGATGEDEGAWILRNSWSDYWGEDGYMRIGYTSARVASAVTYLHYKEWNDHGFDHIAKENTETVTGSLNATGYQPVARGWYEWGDDTSFMINNGTITANGTVDSGDPYVHGMFLWAGNASRIENNEILSATASTNAGQATAYGACLQGHEVTNTGTISVNAASDDDRATAYGVRFFSFDANGVFNNSGSITARAESDDGWAYGLFSSNAHTVDNSGNMTAIGNGNAVAILSDGATTTTNHGRLVANSTQGNAYGMNIFQGTARNNGDIISHSQGIGAHAYGISADTTSLAKSTLGIANTKTIDAQATGTNGTAWGISSWGAKSIFNSGSITATATAADGTAYGITAQGTGTVINAGIVNATAAHAACGVHLSGGTLVNAANGTIEASVTSGTVRALNLENARATNAGTITATGSGSDVYAVYLTESTLLNNGLVTGDTLVGEKSILGGYGTFTGDVLNDGGTVAPGNSIGTLTITEDYTQRPDGTLEIEIGDGESDRLIISGTAYLQGGTLNLIPLGYATGGNYGFLNAATVNGTFGSILSPAILSAQLLPSAGGLSLGVTRNTYASLGANSGQQHLGGSLDAIRPAASGDMEDVLNLVDRMQLAPLQNALNDMAPGIHAAASYASIQNTHRSMGYVRRHWKDLQTEATQTDTPYESSEQGINTTRFNAWGSFVGASSRAKSQDVIPGYNESMTGLVLGLDYTIGENLTTGLAGSYTTQSLNQEDGSGTSIIKTFRGYAYGLWDQNPEARGWYVATALGMGTIRFDTDRDIAFLGREAKSDHSAQDYSLLATTGYDIETGGWTIRPSLNLEYVFLHEEGYDESDARDMNLHISGHDAHSLQSALGVSIARRCRMKQAVLIPEVRLAWSHEFLPEQDDLSARFLAAGPSFDIPSRDIPKDALNLGLAVKAPLSRDILAAFDYECTLTEANEATDHRLGAQLRIRF